LKLNCLHVRPIYYENFRQKASFLVRWMGDTKKKMMKMNMKGQLLDIL